MHSDLVECIQTSRKAREGVFSKTMSVKEANAVSAANHIVIAAHVLDLRERLFIAGVVIPADQPLVTDESSAATPPAAARKRRDG